MLHFIDFCVSPIPLKNIFYFILPPHDVILYYFSFQNGPLEIHGVEKKEFQVCRQNSEVKLGLAKRSEPVTIKVKAE